MYICMYAWCVWVMVSTSDEQIFVLRALKTAMANRNERYLVLSIVRIIIEE